MTTAVQETPNETRTRAAIHMPLRDLQDALSKIAPAIPGPSCSVPVLRTIRFSGDESRPFLSLAASNLDLAMSVELSADAPEHPFLISAERLTGYAKLLEGEAVELKAAERWATLKCGRSTTKLPLDQMANYPALDFELKDEFLEVEQALLGRMIRSTGFAISDEETRYTLNGALLEVAPEYIRLVATDGHRMAMYTARDVAFTEAKKALLPALLLKALHKTLSDKEGEKIVFGEASQEFKARVHGEKPVSISCRKIVGQFPNYQAVIPQGVEAEVVVSAAELLASVNRCVAMSDRESCAVKMEFSAGQIALKAVDPNAGETDETAGCTATKDFATFTTGFNGEYLVEALKHIKGDATLTFAKANAQTALKISAEPNENEKFEYIVMPIRIQGK